LNLKAAKQTPKKAQAISSTFTGMDCSFPLDYPVREQATAHILHLKVGEMTSHTI